MTNSLFEPDCRRCPRLVEHLRQVRRDYPSYHARPVAPFGDDDPSLLVVGLAPGMHGANATGRPFTGDFAGILLYQTLFRFGFSNQPEATALGDGLVLTGCRITNAVKCLPPQNKPLPAEVRTCNGFLSAELQATGEGTVILALGRVAHEAVVRATGGRLRDFPFSHGGVHRLGERHLVDSYHCSRYNTQTGRLTEPMFRQVFKKITQLQATTAL